MEVILNTKKSDRIKKKKDIEMFETRIIPP